MRIRPLAAPRKLSRRLFEQLADEIKTKYQRYFKV